MPSAARSLTEPPGLTNEMWHTMLATMLATATAFSTPTKNAPLPHLIFAMIDDWGWYDVGFARLQPPVIKTPNRLPGRKGGRAAHASLYAALGADL